jgi:SHS2 domain-containing protein
MISKAGYEEIEHTADRAVRVWGPDMAAFLHQAALGMYFLMGIDPGSDGEETKEVAIAFADDEILLVEFLSELLSWLESERMAASSFTAIKKDDKMVFHLKGRQVAGARVAVKAVTYHDLRVIITEEGFMATVVFDV